MLKHASSSRCFTRSYKQILHFVLRPLPLDFDGAVDVILDVCMSSPMYLVRSACVEISFMMKHTHDCKNLFPPSSFSCSFFTVSTRSTIACRLVCSVFACSTKSLRASSPSLSTSSLLLLGDMVRTSPSTYSSSTTVLVASRGTIMVPLLLRLPSFGRDSLLLLGCMLSSSLAVALESDDDDVESSGGDVCCGGSPMDGTVANAEVIVQHTVYRRLSTRPRVSCCLQGVELNEIFYCRAQGRRRRDSVSAMKRDVHGSNQTNI